MDRRGLNKQQFAERLGTGKSHVSQLLNGARNMTLRTLSDIAEALGQHIEIMFHNKEDEALWKPMDFTVRARPVEKAIKAFAANDAWTEVERRA
jgi:transcriptional regulator with XRE-family HTH domain